MSLLTNLFRLIPPTFRPGYCPKTIQQLVNDTISGTQLTFLIQQGSFMYNMGSATPTSENRIFPWLYTPNGRWYTFQFGLWTSPMDPSDREPGFRKMWKPAKTTPESAAWSLDEGDGTNPSTTAPTVTTGAAWEVDHDLDGRFPIGAGTLPTPTLTASVSISDQGGDAQHILTDLEGAVASHIHLLGIADPTAKAVIIAKNGSAATVPGYSGKYSGGGGATSDFPETTADLTTLAPGPAAAGVTSAPFSLLPPYVVVWWLKPTAKLLYTLPA